MLFLSFLSPWLTRLFRVAGCPCAGGHSFFLLRASTKARSNGQKRPRSRSPLELVSIYLASFRCKWHCPCRITRARQRFCQAVPMTTSVALTGNSKSQAPINQKFEVPIFNSRPISGQPCVLNFNPHNNYCLVMSSTRIRPVAN